MSLIFLPTMSLMFFEHKRNYSLTVEKQMFQFLCVYFIFLYLNIHILNSTWSQSQSSKILNPAAQDS